ncbi:MAG: hypothetical protein GYB64_06125, partial [Chloroflexi bacterium]|nr:hypothetical protein [Chloroflexota bacterium]
AMIVLVAVFAVSYLLQHGLNAQPAPLAAIAVIVVVFGAATVLDIERQLYPVLVPAQPAAEAPADPQPATPDPGTAAGSEGSGSQPRERPLLFTVNRFLTGRPLLWRAVTIRLMDRSPVVGFGMDSFWPSSLGQDLPVNWAGQGSPGEAHNGYIETALDTGFIGAGLYIVTLAWALVRALRPDRDFTLAAGLLPAALLVLIAVHNLAESSALNPFDTLFVLFVAAAVYASGDPQTVSVGVESQPVP